MAHTVTIRGSISPAAGVLPRGEEKTVEYSARVQGWIDKGYVDLLSEHLDVEPDVVVPAEVKAEKVLGEPGGNATKEDWAAFLDAEKVDYDPAGGRDQLRDGWYALKAQRAADAAAATANDPEDAEG